MEYQGIASTALSIPIDAWKCRMCHRISHYPSASSSVPPWWSTYGTGASIPSSYTKLAAATGSATSLTGLSYHFRHDEE
jgi:hypothetical protein